MSGFGGGFGLGGFGSSGDYVEIQYLADGLSLATSYSLLPTYRLSASMATTTSFIFEQKANLADAVDLDEMTNAEAIAVLNEALGLALTQEAVAKWAVTLADALTLRDPQVLVNMATIADTLDLDLTGEETHLRLIALVDTLTLTGAATNTISALALIAETLALRAVVTSLQDANLDDSMLLAQLIETQAAYYEELVTDLAFDDDLAGIAVFTVALEDAVAWDETLTPTASLVAAIRDELDFTVAFDLGDTSYVAYSMNAATKGLTSYTNFNFDSLASFKGQTYATGAGGLYRLGGDDDDGDPIVWRVRTGLTNFGTGRNKGLDAAYLGYTATGRVVMKCIVVAPGTGNKVVHWYELTTPVAGAPHTGRILTGRGLKSVYWGFELSNIDEGSIELDQLELHPVVFQGRLP